MLQSKQRLKLWRPTNSTSVKRYVFVIPLADLWISTLSTAEPRRSSRERSRSRLSEYAQVAGLFDSFARGDTAGRLLLAGMNPPFDPVDQNGVYALRVWEARLAFVRVFGWWVQPGVWVAVQGDRVDALKARNPHSPGSYEAHARSVARWRKRAGFSISDIWAGTDLDALLVLPTASPLDR